ncbi:hypothetical protein [uncultured Bacteroides sp.]|uniref:hypothetical protein n=1 Tax=uncultured Bacteroides sp. TaxID=162156 RepID=UPI0025FC9797|nr:hypothetical protein [uncultured Bacteroides sp.]
MSLSFFRQLFSGKERKAERSEPPQPMQFVLNWSEGREQTSRVSEEEIRRAVGRLDEYGDLWLSNCRTVTTPYGDCSGISCKAIPGTHPQVAVYFAAAGGLTRYVSNDYPADVIVRMLCNYFTRLEIPEIEDWEKGYFAPVASDDEPCWLYVDNDEFRYIGYDDVLAALEELDAGKSSSLLLQRPDAGDDYLEVRGTKAAYIVEMGGNDEAGRRVVFTTQTSYDGRVRYWLYNYYHKRELPRLTDEWTDITEI